MNFSERIPIYVQVGDLIVRKIFNGQLKAGDKLPAIKDLAKEYKINANTVVKSLSELENEGLIETRRGIGTFIVDNKEVIEMITAQYIKSRVEEVLKEFKSLGIGPDKVIELIKEYLDDNSTKNN